MTDPSTEPEQPDQTTPQAEQPAEIDLNALLAEQEQYARDVNAEFEAHRAAGTEDQWPQWCDEMTEWNEALAAAREESPTE